MTRSGVNPYEITTQDLAYMRQATRPMWRGDEPLTLDELTEAMRLAGADDPATETDDGAILSSVLFEKCNFVIGKRRSTTARIIKGRVLLRTTVGSVVHGVNVDDVADRDEMGVAVEPPAYVIGMRSFEQHTERSRPDGERSRAGDLDLVVYSLRKFMRLAMSGNPTVLLTLFAPEEFWIETYDAQAAHEFQALAPLIVSQRAGHAFLGYMEQQRQRLVGKRGQKNVKRPELEAMYGFDTKYAMHVLRLGLQGVELLTDGRLTLPMREDDRKALLRVRTGHVALSEVLEMAENLEADLRKLMEGGTEVRPEPDREALDAWLVATYEARWAREREVASDG